MRRGFPGSDPTQEEVLFGMAPYGWKLSPDRRYLVKDPHEQRLMAVVRHMRARGLGMQEIVWELQRMAVVNRRGHPFSLAQVHRVLHDPQRPPPESLPPRRTESTRKADASRPEVSLMAWNPRRSPAGWRGHLLSARFSPSEKIAIDRAAKSAGSTVSAWARRALLAATSEFGAVANKRRRASTKRTREIEDDQPPASGVVEKHSGGVAYKGRRASSQ